VAEVVAAEDPGRVEVVGVQEEERVVVMGSPVGAAVMAQEATGLAVAAEEEMVQAKADSKDLWAGSVAVVMVGVTEVAMEVATAVAKVAKVALADSGVVTRRALSRPRREDYDQYRMGL
jgi:hypothetical protein